MAAIKTISKTVETKKRVPESRLNFRLALDIKERVARAAALTGQDLTEFAVAALNEKAGEVIERHDHLLLGSKDYRFFLDALSSKEVSKPSNRSLKAAENYRRGKRKGVRYTLAD
jgi:uncharacterized protein (DUF1778 family)